jgi:tRNA (cmo5U34)-methyltransferase
LGKSFSTPACNVAKINDSASIEAYSSAQRVARYDADMEVMHPLRRKMVEVVLEVLPFEAERPLAVLDLGAGTGFLTQRLLAKFPAAAVVAVDGSRAMIELARARLGELAQRVTFEVCDFWRLPESLALRSLDAVVSAYALHHLDADEKQDVIRNAVRLLKPGGWFLNADLVVAADPRVEARVQELRVRGIIERARGEDPRFRDFASTRKFLDELEAAEQDQPLTLEQDLRLAREAGLASVEVFWKEYREVVFGGKKTEG